MGLSPIVQVFVIAAGICCLAVVVSIAYIFWRDREDEELARKIAEDVSAEYGSAWVQKYGRGDSDRALLRILAEEIAKEPPPTARS